MHKNLLAFTIVVAFFIGGCHPRRLPPPPPPKKVIQSAPLSYAKRLWAKEHYDDHEAWIPGHERCR